MDERIAVIGMSCRFPAAPTLSDYWSLLSSGSSAITSEPPDETDARPNRPTAGAFIGRVEEFDADFFGISPKEATALDPQQRLALELCWEAMEDAGIIPGELHEKNASVFFGAMRDDYAVMTRQRGQSAAGEHTFAGLQRSMIANRVSYTLRLNGPSMTVDTGQSSSLAALHLAAGSLLRGESDLALVGGVSLLLDADGTVGAELFGGLSPDGQCCPLDERANGFVPGEGAGVVILKPLAAALGDGDRVYCVVRGTGLNNDGGGPGLTHPSVSAQQQLLRAVHSRANTLDEVQFVELHATGTPIGDSVEAQAVGSALGASHDGSCPLLVGSVKSTIGHLEAAAGIAGFIKTVLCVWHRSIVPQSNFRAPAPGIPLAELNLSVPLTLRDWPHPNRQLTAAVSSFGLGGTNCHVVLSEAPRTSPPARQAAPGQQIHLVSGRTRAALHAQATALLSQLTSAAQPPDNRDLAYSLATTRTSFEWRAGVIADGPDSLRTGLRALVQGSPSPRVHHGRVCGREGTAFLFSGQGTQRSGMGRELHQLFTAFASAFDEAADALDPHLPRPLRPMVFAPPDSPEAALLDDTTFTQPALFALETALFRLLDTWGLRPDYLIGHSLGELTAAHLCGVLSLADAALLVANRGRLMGQLPEGAMASLHATEAEVRPLLRDHPHVSIAAVNGPRTTVISGEPAGVRAVCGELARRGRRTKTLRVNVGFHSPQVDAVLDEFASVAGSLTYRATELPVISTLTGTWAHTDDLRSADYWAAHLRNPVRFLDALRTLGDTGAAHLLEIGPDATLSALAGLTLPMDDEAHPVALSLLGDTAPEPDAVLATLTRLHLHGLPVNWGSYFAPQQARRTTLPTYAFQRRAYWLASPAEAQEEPRTGASTTRARLSASTRSAGSGQAPGIVCDGSDSTAGSDAPAGPDAALSGPGRDRALLELVLSRTAFVLGHEAEDLIDPRRSFQDLGMGSASAVQLSLSLSEALGQPVSQTLVYDHPNPASAGRALGQLLDNAAESGGPAEGAADQQGRAALTGDPIAVVALGCRLPGGVTSPQELWSLLRSGRDAVSPFPRDRGWDIDGLFNPDPDVSGTTYVRAGGFLHDAGQFDAQLFGISPREALAMDPQQRLLLETSWETLERAGIPSESLRGTSTGVFIGATAQEYGPRMHQAPAESGGYALTGTTTSVISGRLAYTYGLTGPALTVDTACSSSLVAVHLACDSLARGECTLALAGGVAVLSSPGMWVEFSRQRGLAPDGRCKPFAAAADGTAWSEGVSLVLLERLSDARRNGHQVLAVIRGTAVNQDGASSGLTAPNGPAQERVIRRALADAGVDAADVDVVEAHGTGTTLGDPIEAHALGRTYGVGREADRPLLVGSLKSNIGHTQAAAGVAGLVKMVLALQHGELPASLHIDRPTPRLDWSSANLRLLTHLVPWPHDGRPRRAGISSFGVSGTNAHVVLEEAPPQEPCPAPGTDNTCCDGTGQQDAGWSGPALVWPLSAASPSALRAQAGRLVSALTGAPTFDPRDAGRSLARTRNALDHRAAAVGVGLGSLRSSLEALAQEPGTDQDPDGTVRATALPGCRTVFVFPGQGSQWPGMARGLLATSPVFRAHIDACEQALSAHGDWSLRAVLQQEPQAPSLERDDVVQPALFAVMTGLAEVWRSHGVMPDAVVGHSQGEIAAAWASGALTLQDAVHATVVRSRLVGTLETNGRMASVRLPAEDVGRRLREGYEQLVIAALNGPTSTVVSGPRDILEDFLAECGKDDVRTVRIQVDYASHSADVDPLHGPLTQALAGLAPHAPHTAFHSTVTGRTTVQDGPPVLDGEYWFRNLRRTVRFEPVVRALLTAGYTTFIEMSPHPLLAFGIQETAESVPGLAREAVALASLHRDAGDQADLLTSLARAWCHGVNVDWRPLFGEGPTVPLPTYAFQRRRYWLPAAPIPPAPSGSQSRSASERRLWDAVERQDAEATAATLGIEDPGALSGLLPAMAAWRREEERLSRLDGMCFTTEWAPLAADGPTAAGHWLFAVPEGEQQPWPKALADALTAVGSTTRTVRVRPGADRAELTRRIADAADGRTTTGVVSFLSHRPPAPATPRLWAALSDTALLVQAVDDAKLTAPLWCATRTAVRVDDRDSPADPAQALLWGLGKAAALEYPRQWRGLVDLPETPEPDSLRQALRALSQSGSEDCLAVRAHGVLASRLRPCALPIGRPWRPRGTVLITGGTGYLGARTAKLLARAGAPHLLLISRHGDQAEGAAPLVAELAALGARATVAACDVSDRSALAAVLAAVPAEYPLTGVVHTAGARRSGTIDALNPSMIDENLSAKVLGAQHLHDLTAGQDLDAFVLFSSVIAAVGQDGHGAYGAANAYLDALAQRRRTETLPASSIAWGYFTGGLGAGGADWMTGWGLPPIDPDLAVDLLTGLAAGSVPAVVLARFDWPTFAERYTAIRPAPFLGDIPAVRAAREADARIARDEAPAGRAAAADRSTQDLTDLVRSTTADVLGHRTPTGIAPGRSFRDIGLDSLTAVQLRNRLGHATGLQLPAGVAFSHPTPAELAEYLHTRLSPAEEAPEAVPGTAAPTAEPVAVIGMACRLPGGVDSPDQLWALLQQGTDAISPFPEDRGWDVADLYDPDPAAPGKSYTTAGGFLANAADFDAEFFTVSPREALFMDPQQRLLLETSWEALERADIDPSSLRRTSTGVFAGAVYQDYGSRSHEAPKEMQGYLTTGKPLSVISGRVAYVLGLEGPAVSVDTACSSSLVSIHLACQSLLQGDSTLALAGGVTVIPSPGLFIEFSRQRALSPDGRCRSFSADADGTGFAEGAGMVVLERLSDAQRNGHHVLAVIRASAINQDGASNGLTAPNGASQERVIRRTLDRAGLRSADIDAVEAHGTGTTLGDPIEADALLATYGRHRPADQPLYLGSLKSNIGHTQAAAGVAGLIKTVLAVQYATLPRTLYAENPTAHVDWDSGAIRLLTGAIPWPDTGRPRRAAVSAFGVSGTNAHVIIEQAPEPDAPVPEPTDQPSAPAVWLLSGHTPAALRGQAARLHSHLESSPPPSATAVGHALANTRAQLPFRAALTAPGLDAQLRALRDLADGRPNPDLAQAKAADGRIAFVFPGQGSQWPAMAAGLLESSPVFADSIAQCARALAPHTDWPLLDVLVPEHAEQALQRVDVVQPALFAVQLSLARLWQSSGVRPTAVVGHSQGEIAAACFAGGLSLEDACRVVALRSKVLTRLGTANGMLFLQLSADEVEQRLQHHPELTIATVNSPRSVVVAGPAAALDALRDSCETEGVRARRIAVDYAAHSPQVEEVRADLLHLLAPVAPRGGDIAFYSSVTGTAIDTTTLDAAYWYRNLREPVRFDQATAALLSDGHRVFVEPSPHPLLCGAVLESADGSTQPVTTLPTLRRDEGGPARFTTALANAHIHGVAVDTEALNPGTDRRPVNLPTYAFQHRRFWIDTSRGATTREMAASFGVDPVEHPFLDLALPVPEDNGLVLTGRIGTHTHSWLQDHAVHGSVLLPGTAFVDLALHAGQRTGCSYLEELTLLAPLHLGDGDESIQLHLTIGGPDATGRRSVTIRSRWQSAVTGEPWTVHACGFVGEPPPQPTIPTLAWPPEHSVSVDTERFYARAEEIGHGYGPAFRGLTGIWRRGQDVFTEARLPEELRRQGSGFAVHPALLDAALQGLLVRRPATVELPFTWRGVRLHDTGATTLRTRIRRVGDQSVTVDVFAEAGHLVARLDSLILRPAAAHNAHHPLAGEGVYHLAWKPAAPESLPRPPRAAVLSANPRHRPTAPADGTGLPVHADLATFAESLATEEPTPEYVLHDLTPPKSAPAERTPQETALAAHDAVRRTLRLLKEWLADDRLSALRLVLATRGAVAALPGEVPDPAAAAVWGLVRSAQNEYPDQFTLLDLDGTAPDPDTLASLPLDSEPQIALRDGSAHLARLTRLAPPAPAPSPYDPDRTVLISGGTGTLGRLLARHLVTEHGVRRLLLLSRHEAAATGDATAELAALGARCTVAACDITDRADLDATLATHLDGHRLGAVVHAAGVLDDATITQLTPQQVNNVLRPKIDGVVNLHLATLDREPAVFLLYSGAAGTFGTPGQGHYAAANAFLDAFAQYRRALGLPALSLGWGLWAERSGMTGRLDATALRRLDRLGITPLPSSHNLALHDTAFRHEEAVLLPLRLSGSAQRTPLLRNAIGNQQSTVQRPTTAAEPDGSPLKKRLAGLAAHDQDTLLTELVHSHVVQVLGHASTADVDPSVPFTDLGFDSLTSVELRNRINQETGAALPVTAVFDHPTPTALAARLRETLSERTMTAPLEGTTAQTGTAEVTSAEPDSTGTRPAHWAENAGDTDLFAAIDQAQE
ncbi:MULTISPECIES: type I polyketide synthase [unclassified Streptomyces]|uniref:type I polyketide synthase n=1 Tax=unclassified Streptomyces TaxID=2593676 RepID=UPI00093FC732|nr:type I polyketide synthase [Streptomyces sp. TSRI0281]OKI40766.1 hypothetical protein A6A29_38940 [Streptomyces sp. TSRI0281]